MSRREPLPIALDYCEDCGFIRQTPGLEVQLDYTSRERDTARQLPDYTQQIIGSLSEFGIRANDLVVEVGSNDGTFLKALRAAGYQNLLGVEPSGALAARAAEAGLTVLGDFFGRELAVAIRQSRGAARAVICRHTLEHVADAAGLVQGISDVLGPGGVSFIEVPDTDWIISDLFAHEIWDEHIGYFRAGSLARLLRVSGLMPLRSERIRFRDTRNLLCWSVRGTTAPSSTTELLNDTTTLGDLASFQSRWDKFAECVRAAVAVAPRPIIAIGASHIQLNFLNFAGLDAAVDLLIDDDPIKAGRYAPLASPVPIRATDQVLQSARAGTLLRTAFPYPAWEERVCGTLAAYGIESITPYDLR